MRDAENRTLDAELVAACRRRQQAVFDAMSRDRLDVLFVTHDKDIRYLTGFVGDDTVLLFCDGSSWIITDPRHDEMLDPWRGREIGEVVMGTRHRLFDDAKRLMGKVDGRRLAVQAEHMALAESDRLAAVLGVEAGDAGRFIRTTGLIQRLRLIKDDLEVRSIERAIGVQQEALAAALAQFEPGTTEGALAGLIEYEMKRRGARAASFISIVASGANSSQIHYLTGVTPIGDGPLLIDWGAEVDWYAGDLTRTFCVGPGDTTFAELYEIVLEAQLSAIEASKPGRTCAEIDDVARQVISKAGYGEYFGHGLGHGLGLDVHEEPYFNSLSTDIVLEPGMVMTYEPGIYLPGRAGVRIEDDVLITDEGTRVLSDYPKDLSSATLGQAAAATD